MANEYYKTVTEQGYNINSREYMNKGWELFKVNPGEFVVYTLMALIITALASLIPVFGPIAAIPLLPGIVIVGHKLDKNRNYAFADFFSGYQKAANLFLVVFITMFLVSLLLIPLAYFSFSTIYSGIQVSDHIESEEIEGIAFKITLLLVAGLLLGIFIFLVVGVMWLWTTFFILFHGLGAWAAMEASRKLVLRNWLGTLLFILKLLLISIVAILLTFGIGFLVVIPWLYLTLYSAFEDITKFDDETQKDDLFEHFVG